MSLETIRLSQTAKDQLVWLKRHTGITHWNVLCRWALALSLRDASTPLVKDIVTDSNVEMSWKTFAGAYGDVYLALLKQRCIADGQEPTDEAVSRTLIIHIHRGVGFLHGQRNLRSISDFVSLAVA
ncbi:DNA sulfur modification protein DndE [Streptomyces sp. NPDC001178]|uniref:DNA sulfur modification protein DndE n=1 Tax=Streptomyces sp. S.PNR 29 TaxID=2973805 RepID=UPI0025B13DD4|nr:DNA sulfur modification protein DndE [Streptomyces sp. S.PNR 29]MDN0193908.1 DNA sulfur modification protein DndE [Streptomyces sp. S.PNR 29]